MITSLHMNTIMLAETVKCFSALARQTFFLTLATTVDACELTIELAVFRGTTQVRLLFDRNPFQFTCAVRFESISL